VPRFGYDLGFDGFILFALLAAISQYYLGAINYRKVSSPASLPACMSGNSIRANDYARAAQGFLQDERIDAAADNQIGVNTIAYCSQYLHVVKGEKL
jgi:hypothetical protein